jgi:hypothetical protein
MNENTELKTKLFDAWNLYHSSITNKELLMNSLDDQVKELLNIALVQEKMLPIQSGLGSSNIKMSFVDCLNETGKDNLIWFCDLFVNADGTINQEKLSSEYHQCFQEYCAQNNINYEHIVQEYRNKISNLIFYPVYDEIFKKKSEEFDNFKDKCVAPKQPQNQSNLHGFEKMRFHLRSLGKTFFGGIILLILFGIFVSLEKIALYIFR